MLEKLKSYLAHPLVCGANIDSLDTISLHARMIREKKFLKLIYEQWSTAISNLLPDNMTGDVVEIGSGGGFLSDIIPGLVTSEIRNVPLVDIVMNAQHLPFKKESLKAIVMINVLHHIPSVSSFISGAASCIKPGGSVVMIEPWVTPWSKIIYRYFHHEPFDPDATDWNFSEGGRLSQANDALPWIIFKRDRQMFEEKFPAWHIKDINLHSPFCYLLSGGVSLRSFMPGNLYCFWRKIENMFNPWMAYWAMFATIYLERKE